MSEHPFDSWNSTDRLERLEYMPFQWPNELEILQRENEWYKESKLARLYDPKPGYHWSAACNAWLSNSIERDTYSDPAAVVGQHLQYNLQRGERLPDSPYIPAFPCSHVKLRISTSDGASYCKDCGVQVYDKENTNKILIGMKRKVGEPLLQLSEKDHDTQCHARAKNRGQETFTLVEQDDSAPEVICEWIKQNIRTCTRAKLEEALDSAIKWAQESKVGKKHAD